MTSTTRVTLDATSIPAARGGVGRYVDHLVTALDALGVPLTVLAQDADADHLAALAPHSRIVAAPARIAARSARFAWEQTALPVLLRRLGTDVLHSPHYTMPLAAGVPTVVTLHDATFFSDRHLHTGVKGPFFRTWTTISLRRAAVCVVPSRATADELTRFVPAIARLRAETIVVAPHGVDVDTFHPPTADERAAFAARHHLQGEWIAFLGTLEPRKNVPALIRGYVQAFDGRPNPPALVLAGSEGWDEEIEPALAAVPPGLTVLKTGHLPVAELRALLGGALLSAYPSLGEGFGLPVLESMACGAATLTTRRLALPEVGGEAVAYCGTADSEISTALRQLVDDPGRRGELAQLGRARAATFTWAACAEQHVTAYELAARGTGSKRVGGTSASGRLASGGLASGGSKPVAHRAAATPSTGPLTTGPLGVVTVTYSPGETLAGLLDSLPAATSRSVLVVVSDNGSTDGSLELAEQRPNVTVLRNAENLGYGRAVNAGMALLPAEADPVLIVNPDVVLDPGSLDELLAALARHPDAGAVGPLITTPAGDLYPSARELPSVATGVGHALFGWCWPTNPWTRSYRLDHAAPSERVAGWLSGSCLLIRREAFDAVGGFDPAYFMYFEDVDLGDRLGQAGWSNVYVPSATAMHIGGHSASRHRPAMTRAHHDSAYRYLAGRYPKPWQAPLRLALKAGLRGRTLLALRSAAVDNGAKLPKRS